MCAFLNTIWITSNRTSSEFQSTRVVHRQSNSSGTIAANSRQGSIHTNTYERLCSPFWLAIPPGFQVNHISKGNFRACKMYRHIPGIIKCQSYKVRPLGVVDVHSRGCRKLKPDNMIIRLFDGRKRFDCLRIDLKKWTRKMWSRLHLLVNNAHDTR